MSNDQKVVPQDGPEFAPQRDYIKAFPIVVIIYNKNDEVIREERMDYGNHEHKKWLGRLSMWAWQQGHTVQTEAE